MSLASTVANPASNAAPQDPPRSVTPGDHSVPHTPGHEAGGSLLHSDRDALVAVKEDVVEQEEEQEDASLIGSGSDSMIISKSNRGKKDPALEGVEEDGLFHEDQDVTSAFNTTGLWTHPHRCAPYDVSRLEREALLQTMTFPASYATNTQKEDMCLEYVDLFRTQFVQLYPNHPRLLLTPQNELGVRKFLTSFLKPSELSFEELYDAEGVATFLSHYIRYEPLEDRSSLSTLAYVVSPTTTLRWQVGNCLEIALVLCSVLLGTGHDAYVVIGYAAEEICGSNTQVYRRCPRGVIPHEEPSETRHDTMPPHDPANPYTVRERPSLTSQFDQKKSERPRSGLEGPGAGASRLEEHGDEEDENSETEARRRDRLEYEERRTVANSEDPDNDNNGDDDEDDEDQDSPDSALPSGLCAHAWVLIRGTGKRDRQEDYFIEVSTGECFPVQTAPQAHAYLHIEALFNDQNCWIHMAPRPSKTALKSRKTGHVPPIRSVHFDVSDNERWESIFLCDANTSTTGDGAPGATNMGTNSNSAAEPNLTNNSIHDTTAGAGAGLYPSHHPPASEEHAGTATINDGSGAIVAPDPMTAGADASHAAAVHDWSSSTATILAAAHVRAANHPYQRLDVPLSWVSPLTLTQQQYNNRYPGRTKVIQYANATVEHFAEYSQRDLKTLRVTLFDEHGRMHLHVLYQKRADRLRHYALYPHAEESDSTIGLPSNYHMVRREWYDPGRKRAQDPTRSEGLREVILEQGKCRTLYFYWKAREDGLWKRVDYYSEPISTSPPPPPPDPTVTPTTTSTPQTTTRGTYQKTGGGALDAGWYLTTPLKTAEFFDGRSMEDRLVYRSTTYGRTEALPGAPREGGMGGKALSSTTSAVQLTQEAILSMVTEADVRIPNKMTEKFSRNPDVPAHTDLYKITYFRPQHPEGEICVLYHYGERITHPYRIFARSNPLIAAPNHAPVAGGGMGIGGSYHPSSHAIHPSSGVALDAPRVKWNALPYVAAPKEQELKDDLKRLLQKEKECLATVRRDHIERRDLCESRGYWKDLRPPRSGPLYNAYDTLRQPSQALSPSAGHVDRTMDPAGAGTKQRSTFPVASRDLQTGSDGPTTVGAHPQLPMVSAHAGGDETRDYLAPYLAVVGLDPSTMALTAQQVQEVRERALVELKDRLIRRAQIMQSRLEEERERLAKRQATFQKSQELSESTKDQEEFLLFCEQATSRIRIFERRLEKHQEQALQRYAELDAKLRADPRLQLRN